jgi:nucleoside-diphosphate-sugar epimerase
MLVIRHPERSNSMQQKTPHAIVIGATGRLGAACVHEFAAAGWHVSALARSPVREPSHSHPRVAWIAADIADVSKTKAAVNDADVLIHAANPHYTKWPVQALSMAKSALDLAQGTGATFLFPGNVYNFGASMPPVLTEKTAQQPSTVKGKIRCEIESEISSRTARGMRAITLRAGDFFGAGSGSWFDMFVAKSIHRGKLVYPGPLDVMHAWSYLPDLARTFVALANTRKTLEPNAIFHFAGHSVTGREFLRALETAARSCGIAQQGDFTHGTVPWGFYRLLKHFVPILREVVEMEYLWRTPHSLDQSRLVNVIGEVPHTPLVQALAAALDALPDRQYVS